MHAEGEKDTLAATNVRPHRQFQLLKKKVGWRRCTTTSFSCTSLPFSSLPSIFTSIYFIIGDQVLLTMRFPLVFNIPLSISLATLSHAGQPNRMRNLHGLDQIPLATKDPPITRTRTITHTHFEVNIVSTVYRTRPTHTSSAAEANREEVPVWYSASDNQLCDLKACAIYRTINDCNGDGGEWYDQT